MRKLLNYVYGVLRLVRISVLTFVGTGITFLGVEMTSRLLEIPTRGLSQPAVTGAFIGTGFSLCIIAFCLEVKERTRTEVVLKKETLLPVKYEVDMPAMEERH